MWLVQKSRANLFHQSDANLNESRLGCRVFTRLTQFGCFHFVFFHWLFKVFSFLLIGCCDYFGFAFTTLNRKALSQWSVIAPSQHCPKAPAYPCTSQVWWTGKVWRRNQTCCRRTSGNPGSLWFLHQSEIKRQALISPIQPYTHVFRIP